MAKLIRRCGFIAATWAASTALAQSDLLPDIIVRQADLYDNDIVEVGGQRLLRLSNGTPNIGVGKLYLYGGTTYPDNTRDVWQRVYRTNGTWWDRLAGKFIYHPQHGHIHFDDWAQYNLREYLPGGGVGDIVAQGEKTSFCILDLVIYDSSLPNFDPDGQFLGCGTAIQGLSVGWMDIYSRTLEGQSIDITSVPDGTYWLESVVDPDNHVLESNDSNNVARIVYTLNTGGGPISPDAYEPNDSVAEVNARPVGTVNSPNLGPCGPQREVNGLSIHESGNADYFKFYMPATGTSSDFIRVEFTRNLGELKLALLNAAGTVISTFSLSGSNYEQVPLNNRPAGWYFARVIGYAGDTNPNARLIVNPATNGTPSITTLTPPAGNTNMIHGFDTFTVNWTHSDPESNEAWVSVYLNTSPVLDGNEILIPDSLNVPAGGGFHNVNSAHVESGTYWVYCQITDGGTVTGDWSAGTVTFTEPCLAPCDLNCDGSVNPFDVQPMLDALGATPPAPCSPCAGDTNGDGTVNPFDIQAFLECLTP